MANLNSQADKIRPKSVVRYAFMPEIMPRIRRLSGILGNFAYMLAVIYRSARLIPSTHAMLNPANIGRYGIRDVIATAANNLVIKRENTDQIMIFGAVLFGVIMIVIQGVLIAFYAFFQSAFASSKLPADIFTTTDVQNDVVFNFLQRTIGLDKFFNDNGPIGFSPLIAKALHEMLGLYSTAMMVIAVIIVIYYVITVVGESAQSGTPFGRRFNGLWAPIRLVLALGLLVPLGGSLNTAQYIALYTAKFGSSLATSAWTTFSVALKKENNFKLPLNLLSMYPIGKQVFLNEVCMASYNRLNPGTPMTYKTEEFKDKVSISYGEEFGGGSSTTVDKTFFYFGWKKPTDPPGPASVDCGGITMESIPEVSGNAKYNAIITRTDRAYKAALNSLHSRLGPLAEKYAENYIPKSGATLGATKLPTPQEVEKEIQDVDKALVEEITGGESEYAKSIMEQVNLTDISKNGWGNAATYYVRFAYANQKFQNIIQSSFPQLNVRKEAKERVAEHTVTFMASFWDLFGQKMNALGEQYKLIGVALDKAQSDIVNTIPDRYEPEVKGRKYMTAKWETDSDFMKGLKDFFMIGSFQKLYEGTHDGVFPMILLNNIGTEIITKAVKAFALGTITSILLPSGVSNIIFLFGFLGLGVGFVLCYILPFMPFIYFFFAVVEWVMSVVEALIGAPLWALAHLRIDGEGMPGQAAMNGYMIMMGILIRPTLILFGLLASYIMFNAGAYFLNNIFGGAVEVIADGPTISPLAFIAYLLIYTIICYNLALVCFKMVDTIPNQSMRWLGTGNLNFNDGKTDPVGNLDAAATFAGGFLGQQAAGAFSSGINEIKTHSRTKASEATAKKQRAYDTWHQGLQSHLAQGGTNTRATYEATHGVEPPRA